VNPDEVTRTEVIIVGGGLSGIGAGAVLHREGVDDYLLLEKADQLGGTWYHNTYPDCGCDIPTPLYQFRFRMNPQWSQLFAERDEIHRYLLTVAEENDVGRHARFGVEVIDARWNEEAARWRVETTKGVFESRLLFLATGSLHDVNVAEIAGRDTFAGEMFHSAQWRDGYDGAGHRVAVIGTGASSIQLTPALIRKADKVVVFQRTPAWIQPKPNIRHGRITHALFRRFPAAQRLLRGIIWAYGELVLASVYRPLLARLLRLIPQGWLWLQIRDRELRRKLTPDYEMGCKRLLVSGSYYRAIRQPNVELIDSGVAEITENSVIAANGERREVDTIVFATGFVFGVGPLSDHVFGRDGRSLAQVWQGSPRAYLGTVVAGFPNLVLLWGPNTGTTSVVVSVEAQLRYVGLLVRAFMTSRMRSITVGSAAEAAFKDYVNQRTEHTVQSAGGCVSWYLDEKGNNQLLWPGTMLGMWRRMSRFDLDPYEITYLWQRPAALLSTPEEECAL
jgi:cation diffusion facilitator CzcD-associated flavoprotein CzcO